MIKAKSLIVFGVVCAVLGVSGTWLHDGGWLQMPRIFDVPTVLGGSGEAQQGQRGPGAEGEQMPPRDRGGHNEGNGLNWNVLPGVLANLWIIALIIAVGVYGVRVIKGIFRQVRREMVAA